jgi:hypothetical protein
MKLAGNHGQSRRTLHELDCALSGPGRSRGSRDNPVDDYVETHGAAGHPHTRDGQPQTTHPPSRQAAPARAVRHARRNPPGRRSLTVTACQASPPVTLTSTATTFTPIGLTTFLLRWSPRKRGAHLPWSWPAAAARQGQAYVNMDPAER